MTPKSSLLIGLLQEGAANYWYGSVCVSSSRGKEMKTDQWNVTFVNDSASAGVYTWCIYIIQLLEMLARYTGDLSRLKLMN